MAALTGNMLNLHHGRRLAHPDSLTQNLKTLQRRLFRTSNVRLGYDETIANLKIGAETRVIYQGFTGRVSTANAQQSLDYGTKVVGGTTPGKEGEHLGLPLLPSVREAAEKLKPHATAVFVAAQHAAKAIQDAIEAEIPLIVAVAEFIPVSDMLRTQSKSRLVGANSPGIIAPLGNCRIGFQPLPSYMPGNIGVIAKSGTLSYEAVGSLTRAGLGQSVCIGMGGDIIAGTNMVEALEFFEHDNDTEGILVIGEVGGRAEQDAADWIKEYNRRTARPKPISAVVGGMLAKPGRIMGHAGAFQSLGEDSAATKAAALANAGVTLVQHPSEFGPVMRHLLEQSGRGVPPAKSVGSQKRSIHTRAGRVQRTGLPLLQSRRSLHLSSAQSKSLLKDRGIAVTDAAPTLSESRFLAVTIDRSKRRPALVASPTGDARHVWARAKHFDYDYASGPDAATKEAVLRHLQLSSAPPLAMAAAQKLVDALVALFKDKEAYALATHLSGQADGSMAVHEAQFSFDDAAFRAAKRQADIHALRNVDAEDADELSVERDGIVYIKYDDPKASIGTLVNGAGLAMNAIDALAAAGVAPTNFLDTGGKATKETVRQSFQVLLRDARVKVIFVNIFGGLTLCDMIAEGILLAFRDLRMKIPVVVRLRGTNEEIGQRMVSFILDLLTQIASSGLPVHAYDDFFEAAAKCRELAASAAR